MQEKLSPTIYANCVTNKCRTIADVIPLDVTSGQVHWSANGSGMMIGRSEQADLVGGISSNYACMNCCGDRPYSQRVSPSTATIDEGGSSAFIAEDQFVDCYQNVGELMYVSAPI